MPREGIFAEVLNEGEIKVGDEIIIQDQVQV
jgi:MOSC domain-containing protein YiiM